MRPYLNMTLTDNVNYLAGRNGSVVRSYSGKQGSFLLTDGRLRFIPNLDTFNAMHFSQKEIRYFSDKVIDNAPKGPPMPACTIC